MVKLNKLTGEPTFFNKSNSGLPGGVSSIAIDGSGNKWIGTIYGGLAVYKEGGVVSVVEKIKNILPNEFSLSQNYPNPFNPSTTITYNVPERSNVRLFIFTTLGQKIFEIVNETKDAGSYEYSFNASQLSSGIYFYRIEATSTQNSGKTFVNTKKMVLLR